MAVTGHKNSVHIRSANKEPEWSSICNNVFDQYLDDDDPFGFPRDGQRDRSNSDDSDNLFDFSGSSEQSHQTDATSPIPAAWDPAESLAPAAQQPKAKAPTGFWHKKLRALEQNAAEHEKRQHKLRTAKSHPDFLSLGGFPSPPAIPKTPTGQAYSRQRQKSRTAANGKRTPTQQRSVTNLRAVSRGRPVGVTKPPASAAAYPYATVRQRNVSPAKMMTPSRYRAGFKDVWAERIESSPTKFQLRVPSSTSAFPASPPPSARSFQDSFAAFGSPTFAPVSGCDEQISPLAKTFQQAASIHTPIASPLLSPGSRLAASYFDPPPPLPSNPYNVTVQSVPLNDTAPLYPERGSSLAANRIQEFDFGFSSSPPLDDPFNAPFVEPTSAPYTSTDPFIEQDTLDSWQSTLNINARNQNANLGLGINCDPTLVSGNYVAVPGTGLLQNTAYQPLQQPPPSASPFYVPSLPNGLPSTPQRPRQRNFASPTRSPSPPATDQRTNRTSTSRRASRHRRTKSASTTPRHDRSGGFVNFTPSDSNKILSGVAPSGSSKTKARREKEAADKRRKLSQAAMQAVIEAGGDVESLQRAGLIS